MIATLEIGLKRTSVIALLLYRPVLKKAITIEEVELKFGTDVTLIIRRLLKTSDLYARNTAVTRRISIICFSRLPRTYV